MSAIRLSLDEDVWPDIAVVLREHGFDVVHSTLNLLRALSAEEIANTVHHLDDYR
jgi:hypothetical protein